MSALAIIIYFASITSCAWSYSEDKHQGPMFISEPPSRVEFLNTTGASVQCLAHGIPDPIVEWVTTENNIPVTNVPNIREILPNNTLVFYPFGPSSYMPDVHAAMYRCAVTNIGGSIVSRDVHVRAAVKQNYESQVHDEFVIRGNTGVLKCQIPNFVEEFITVSSWLRDETITIVSDFNEIGRYSVLPMGELHIRNVGTEDHEARFRCRTKHRLTGETKLSGTYGKIHMTEPRNSVPPAISDKKVTFSVKIGQMAELSCAAQGYPIPEYKWYTKSPAGKLIKVKASRRVTVKGGLIRFSEALIEDSNTYECMVNNTVGMERREMILIVTEPLATVVKPKSQVVDVGKSSVFKCHVTGYPIESVTWIKDMEPLYADGRRIRLMTREELHVTSVQREDKGMYQCFAYNKIESAQGSSQLILGDAAPVLLETFEERTLQPGPSISLKCVASGSPLPEIRWTLDGVQVPKHERIQVGDFIAARNGDVTSHVNISNVRADDGGYYSCAAKNKIGLVKYGGRLNIFGVPYIREMANRSVISGKTLNIQCPVAGYPVQTIVWERGGKPLPVNHAQKVFKNGTLMVHNVQPDFDEGQYTCIARNKQGQSARKTVYVKILVPPLIDGISFPRKLRIVKSRRMSIHCTVVLGDLPIKIEWKKDGKAIQPDLGATIRNFETESTLLIRSISSEHNGTYTCTATNPAASVFREAVVIVDAPPSWKIEPKDVSVALGSVVYIHCQAKGSPLPEITWRRAKGQEFETIYSIRPFKVFDNGTLAVYDITKDLGGRYLCQGSNNVGKSISKVIGIDIRIPAYFETKLRNQTVRKGDDTILRCKGFGDPPMFIVWNRDAKPLDGKSRKRYMIKKYKVAAGIVSELHIGRTERKDTATFMCQVSNNYGNDFMTTHLIVLEPPEPPINLRAKVFDSRGVEVSWKHPFDGNSPISKYIIQYKNFSNEWDKGQVPYQTLKGTTTKLKITDFKPASKYHVRLIAENSEGISESSDTVTFTTSDAEPDAPPRNVTVEVIGTRSFEVSWMVPEKIHWNGLLKGYYVGHKEGDGSDDFSYKSTNISNEFNSGRREYYRISGLKRNKTYAVVVQAFNSAGVGPKSDSVFATTLAEGVGLYPPFQPTLELVTTRHTALTLRWDLEITEDRPVREYVLFYKWGKDKSKIRLLDARKINNTIMLGNLKCGTEYQLNITANNGMGNGQSSNVITASTLGGVPKPPKKDVFIISNTTFLMLDMSTWEYNGCSLMALLIEYKSHKSEIWKESLRKLDPKKDILVFVRNLRPSTFYNVKVIARNEAGLTSIEYDVKTLSLGLRSSAADLFTGDMTFVLSAVGLIALIALVLIIVSICLCVRRKKQPVEKNHIRKAVNGNNNNKKKVELPDVPGPVKNNNKHHQQQNNRSHSPKRQNSATYENTAANLIYCPKDEELMPYAKMVLGAKMEDAEEGPNNQVEFKTFYMKAGARRTDPPPLPPRDDSLATKVATLRRNPRPPASYHTYQNGNEQPGDESDIYREPDESELPPPPSSLSRIHNNNPSNKQGLSPINNKAQNNLNSLSDGPSKSDCSTLPPPTEQPTSTSGYYSNTPPVSMSQTGVYTNFPPPPPPLDDLEKANSYYSNSSIIAQHQANLHANMQVNPHYQMVTKKPRRFVPGVATNSFRRASEDVIDKSPLMKNPPPPSQLRASATTLSSSDVSELESESRDHIATRLHKEILGAINSNKQEIPQSVV